jgi:hypothetical protein
METDEQGLADEKTKFVCNKFYIDQNSSYLLLAFIYFCDESLNVQLKHYHVMNCAIMNNH